MEHLGRYLIGKWFPCYGFNRKHIGACKRILDELAHRSEQFTLLDHDQTVELLLRFKQRLVSMNRWDPERILLWEMFDEEQLSTEPETLPKSDHYLLFVGECSEGSILARDGALLREVAHAEAPTHWDMYICDYPDISWCFVVTHEWEVAPMFIRFDSQT